MRKVRLYATENYFFEGSVRGDAGRCNIPIYCLVNHFFASGKKLIYLLQAFIRNKK